MAEFPVRCPFRETHGADQRRLHPSAPAHLRGCDVLRPSPRGALRQICKWALIDPALLHFAKKAAQPHLVEASADLASKLQLSFFEIPHEQSAKMRPRACRERVAADHEFLLPGALQLDPRAAANAGLVTRTQPFADDTFQAAPADLL